jgi:hypothetical protein
MPHSFLCRRILWLILPLLLCNAVFSQGSFKSKFSNSSIYTGIEVGSKGVKMSVIEIGKNAKSNGAFNILKDSSVNTDFISFTEPTFRATLKALTDLYTTANKEYKIPAKRIFTVISSGVKMQAEKDARLAWVNSLIDSFRIRIKEPGRDVEVVDVIKEAKLSHLGIVPDARRYTTFLIDIGSGNTKGGFFPYGNTEEFRLFQVNWGTKSTANATEKGAGEDQSLNNFQRTLTRVLNGAENNEIIYAVNASGAYPVSDNVAVSGGIAWAVATLTHPELIGNTVVSVSFDEIVKFSETLFRNYASLSEANLTKKITDEEERQAAIKEIKRVHSVFDQKSLLSGTGLLLKIMRQFTSAFETKQFYLVKSGQVGWVSAYVVDENTKDD